MLNSWSEGTDMKYIFPLIACVIWGGNTIVNKLTAGVIAPAEIGFYRWLFAFILLTPFVIRPLYGNRHRVRRQLWRLVVLGLLGGTIFQCFAYFAAPLTSALNMGIIQSLMPLMAIVLSSTLLTQRLTFQAILGAATSLIGVMTVVSQGHLAALLAHGFNAGDGMMLLATLAYACYSVLLKRWRPDIPLLHSLYVQAAVATIAMLPLYLVSPKLGLTVLSAPLVLYAGALASIVAPLTWMHGINQLGPTRMSLFFNLIPIITTCLAAAVLSEHITVYHLLGGTFTLGGVFIAEARTATESDSGVSLGSS
jgi:drug/metabolite transporter (DMT)-like permease